MQVGLLPVRNYPRRASPVKAVYDRRATGYRGKAHGARTLEDGLDKPDPKVAEFAPIGSREGYGPDPSFGEDYPLSAVHEFTCRVEVTGVACCLNDHMQEDIA